MTPTFFAKQSAFRNWLEKNHKKEAELLVGFYKVNDHSCVFAFRLPLCTRNTNMSLKLSGLSSLFKNFTEFLKPISNILRV